MSPKMMPGQEPYTPAELVVLHRLVRWAAEGDPGEQDEPRTGLLPATEPCDTGSSSLCEADCYAESGRFVRDGSIGTEDGVYACRCEHHG